MRAKLKVEEDEEEALAWEVRVTEVALGGGTEKEMVPTLGLLPPHLC